MNTLKGRRITMLLRDVQEKYSNYLYLADYVTIAAAKATGLIPAAYIDPKNPKGGIFPDYCLCGSENAISRNLKHARCCNPRCKIKIGLQLSKIFSDFGIKGVGDSICTMMVYRMWDDMPNKSPMDVIALPFEKYPLDIQCSVAGQNFRSACIEIKNVELTFAEMVAHLGIEGIGSISKKLFADINSVEDLIFAIEKQGSLKDFCTIRGIYDRNVITNFYMSLQDILLAQEYFGLTLRRTGKITLEIAITGRVYINGAHLTKSDFVRLCNKVAVLDNGTQLFEVVQKSSATQSVNFVIADTPSNSAKYRVGKSRGILKTGQEFLNYLQEEVRKCQEKITEMDSTLTSTKQKTPEIKQIENF